jgi:hypothetical protein
LVQSRSGIEQAPGPRGSPHDPQPPDGPADSANDPELRLPATANTESCGANCLLWHFGQDAFWLPKIRASNRCSHLVQTYSNIGMGILRAVSDRIYEVWELLTRGGGHYRTGVALPSSILKLSESACLLPPDSSVTVTSPLALMVRAFESRRTAKLRRHTAWTRQFYYETPDAADHL